MEIPNTCPCQKQTSKEFLKFATETCHLSPSPVACKTTMRVVLNDLRRCGENDEAEYLTKSNSVFFTDRCCSWHITTCRREIDGVISCRHAPLPRQVKRRRVFFDRLKPEYYWKLDVLPKSWLISRTPPDLLVIIYGLPSRWPIFGDPSPITTEQLAPAAMYLANPNLFLLLLLKTTKEVSVSAMYNDKQVRSRSKVVVHQQERIRVLEERMRNT